MSWAEWKAAALNRLFLEQGTSGQPGRITAETVLHGERMNRVTQQRQDRKGGPVAMGVYKRGRVWWYRFTWKGRAVPGEHQADEQAGRRANRSRA